jgi:hypothetical protein
LILEGLDRRPDRIVARTQYRERGCEGAWQRFEVAIEHDVTVPFVFEWNATAEGECTWSRVHGASVEPLESASRCGQT